MHKKWIYILGGAAVAYYLAGTSSTGPLAGVVGPVFETGPTALGIAPTAPIYAVEGAALGLLVYHLMK